MIFKQEADTHRFKTKVDRIAYPTHNLLPTHSSNSSTRQENLQGAMLRNTNRIAPIRQRDLARTKLDTTDPTGHAYFEAQVAMKVRSTGALQYIAGTTLSSNIGSYRKMHERKTQEQLLYIDWSLAHPDGRPKSPATSATSTSSSGAPSSPPGPPSPDMKFHKDMESLQRQLALAEKHLKEEREAFSSVLVYIKQVTTPYQTTQIDSILSEKVSLTDTDCLPPHVAHAKIMHYICTTFCTTPIEVRKRIDHERAGTGMAEDKGTYMILLDTMDLYRTILRDFDAIHFKTRTPLGMDEEIYLIMERVRRGQNELTLIYAEADKLRTKTGLTLDEFITTQRAACQAGILSLDQLQEMDAARAKAEHTGTLAQANTVAMSSMSMNPPQHQQQAYHAGYEDDDQERYQMVAFRAVDNGWRGAASSSSSSASSSSTARGPAGRKVELNTAMLGWSATDPVPVPVPAGPPVFGGYDRSQIPPRKGAAPGFARPIPLCNHYPYCDYNGSEHGCRFRHVTTEGYTDEEDRAEQAWHDGELMANRSGGRRNRPPGTADSSGSTPGGLVKRARFDRGLADPSRDQPPQDPTGDPPVDSGLDEGEGLWVEVEVAGGRIGMDTAFSGTIREERDGDSCAKGGEDAESGVVDSGCTGMLMPYATALAFGLDIQP